jgi:ABC-type transport system substrate-binding protein
VQPLAVRNANANPPGPHGSPSDTGADRGASCSSNQIGDNVSTSYTRSVVGCDPRARKPVYDQLRQLISDDEPVTFLYQNQSFIPSRKTLNGMSPTAFARPSWNVYDWNWSA